MEISLSQFGFKVFDNPSKVIENCSLILTKKNLNINRAVAVINLDSIPDDMHRYLQSVRKAIAWKVGFFPFFYGLGLQVIVICPGISEYPFPPKDFVALMDNQWAIIQSVFFVDPKTSTFREGLSWAQFITGKYQQEISDQLMGKYGLVL